MPAGGGASVYCEVPGNKKEGYCSEKDQMLLVWPAAVKARQSLSLKVVMPPGRRGCAGPRMMIFWDADGMVNRTLMTLILQIYTDFFEW